MDSPTIEGSLAETVVVVVTSYMKIVVIASTEVIIDVTLAPLGNDLAVDLYMPLFSFLNSKTFWQKP